jgi:hypothetical protein
MKKNLHPSQRPQLPVRRQPLALLANGPGPSEKPEGSVAISLSFEEIQRRAHTITPLLRELLDHRPPSHWGINE